MIRRGLRTAGRPAPFLSKSAKGPPAGAMPGSPGAAWWPGPLPLLSGAGARDQFPQLVALPDRHGVEAGLPEVIVVDPAVVEDVDRAAAGGNAGGLDAGGVVRAVAGGGLGR